jgi:hypothetical protein
MSREVPGARSGVTLRLLVVTAILTGMLGCRQATRPTHAHPAPHSPNRPPAESDWEHDVLPPRDAYAGSEACRDCHEKNFNHWSHDWHARALSAAKEGKVAGNFNAAHFRGTSSEAWMVRRGAQYIMRTRGPGSTIEDFPVSWVIGGKRMQDAITVFGDGRWQVLPVYYHLTGGGAWVDYNEAKQGVIGPDHPYYWTNFRRMAAKECLECHATGVDVRYDPAQHRWTTSFVDPGVACEDCHGPGARHAETKAKGDIVHPGHVSPSLGLAICGRCHGPHEPVFPLLDSRDQFKPGDRYEDRFQPLVVTDGTERSGEYFADGRPGSSSFEYQALIQSRCYLRGGATCLTCHTAPHEAHGRDDLKLDASHHADPDASCRGCHKEIAGAAAAHSHHRGPAGQSCVACHMPRVLSGVLDHFPDHSIDIPNPANTVRHAVPNACNVCHSEKPPQEMQQAMERWWPAIEARQHRRLLLADAIDEKAAGGSLPALASVLQDRSEAPSLRGAAAVLLGQRFPGDASRILSPLLQEPDPLLRSRVVEALGYARSGDAADAIAALLLDPSIPVRQMSAMVLASLGDPRGKAAIEALTRNPATQALVRPHIMMGIDYANRGDFDRAEAELHEALRETPYLPDALVLLADISMRRQNPVQARADLEEALRFDPSHRGAIKRLHMIDGP